jgi:hypothetical protein
MGVALARFSPTQAVIDARAWLSKLRREKRNLLWPEPVPWPDQGIPPTRETLSKLRTDTINRLAARGLLDQRQIAAAVEIHEVWSAFTRAAFRPRFVSDRVDGGGKILDVFDLVAEPVRQIWVHRYMPWARRQAAPVRDTSGVATGTRLELVMDVVVDNRGTSECDLKFGFSRGNGHSLRILRSALNDWWSK